LIGGSFFVDAPSPPAPEDPPFDPETSLSDPEEPLAPFELGFVWVVAAVVVELATGVGVDSGSDSGDDSSPPVLKDLDSAELDSAEVDSDVDVPEAPAEGNTTFSGERAEASVSLTLELAASPMIAPKPRNTRTSSAEIGREGSLGPEGARADSFTAVSGATAPTASLPAASLRASLPATRRRRSSSCGLRSPTRAPQRRQ
jgi:hypothetical protein